MTQTAVQKQCNHCQKTFEPKNTRQIYCSDTCKVYASKARKESNKIIEISGNELISAKESNAITDYFAMLDEYDNLRNADIREVQEGEDYFDVVEEKHKLERQYKKKLDYKWIEAYTFYAQIPKNTKILDGKEIAIQDKICKMPKYWQNYFILGFDRYDIFMPFYMIVYGDAGEGKTYDTLKFFNSFSVFKILYVASFIQKAKGITSEITDNFKNILSNDNFKLMFSDDFSDVFEELSSNNYLILAIDCYDEFNIKPHTLDSLRKKYPFLSIIVLSKTRLTFFENICSYIKECDNTECIYIKIGGTYDYN